MQIKPIRNQRDYRRALKEINQLMDATPNTPRGDRLDVLATQIVAWEEKYCSINTLNLNAAIDYNAKRSAPKTPRRG